MHTDTHPQSPVKDHYINKILNNGVCVFKNKITPEQIQMLITEITNIREYVMAKLKTLPRPLRTYSDIAERELGRLDYRCGFTADIFEDVARPIHQLIKNMSPTIDFRSYWGAIPSLSHSGPTDLHRDVYPLLNTMEGNHLDNLDINLPPYYFTVLIPLVQITKENGPTEFIEGSHRKPIVDESKETIYAPLLSPGDFVIFEGRTLHRGSANNSDHERLVAYITYIANWYHDQTFELNDYLFPELSQKS